MEDLDKLYDVIYEIVNKGYIFQVDEKENVINPILIDRTSLIKINGYTIKLEETYNKDTREVERVIAIVVEDNIKDGHGRIVDFNDENWYNNTKITGDVLIIDIDYNSNEFDVTTGHTFGRGIITDSQFFSIDEENAKHYSKEILRELRALEDFFVGSTDEFNREKDRIDQKAKIIPNEKIIEALRNLDLRALKTGNFEHKMNDIIVDVTVEKEKPFVKEEKVEKPKEENKYTLERLIEHIKKLSSEEIKELTIRLEEKEEVRQLIRELDEQERKEKERLEKEKLEKPKYSESTMARFEQYREFLLNHGARKDIIELPAIQDIILDVIEHGDPRIKFEGKSPVIYNDPKEDGTFDIYGRLNGPSATVAYEMDLDEQEENGYYISLTKKDVRNNTFLEQREPDENIYLDREGKIIENLNSKTR